MSTGKDNNPVVRDVRRLPGGCCLVVQLEQGTEGYKVIERGLANSPEYTNLLKINVMSDSEEPEKLQAKVRGVINGLEAKAQQYGEVVTLEQISNTLQGQGYTIYGSGNRWHSYKGSAVGDVRPL